MYTHSIGSDFSLSRYWVMHMLNKKGTRTDSAPLLWTKIPEHQVIGSSANGEFVPLGNQGLCQGACIGHKGLGVFHKSRCVHL